MAWQASHRVASHVPRLRPDPRARCHRLTAASQLPWFSHESAKVQPRKRRVAPSSATKAHKPETLMSRIPEFSLKAHTRITRARGLAQARHVNSAGMRYTMASRLSGRCGLSRRSQWRRAALAARNSKPLASTPASARLAAGNGLTARRSQSIAGRVLARGCAEQSGKRKNAGLKSPIPVLRSGGLDSRTQSRSPRTGQIRTQIPLLTAKTP